jgi:redox-sensitive bicupin YhaK (pirin superfamily)
MTITRKLSAIHTPRPQPGFLGRGHTARAVIETSFAQSDPFIMLMDDELDKKDNTPAGGPHPHAGFETVTLMIEGEIGADEHTLRAGDLQMMTAGSGVVHTETIEQPSRLRLLQLWLTLPKKDRWAPPRLQDLSAASVPAIEESGLRLRVYSGTLNGLRSPLQNYVPVIIADFALEPGAATTQQLPAAYNGFVYVLHGSVRVGDQELRTGQVGWLDRHTTDATSELTFEGGSAGSRFVLYAGEPQGEAIVSHGPFIGDTQEDIVRLYREYRLGRMGHINAVAEELKLSW